MNKAAAGPGNQRRAGELSKRNKTAPPGGQRRAGLEFALATLLIVGTLAVFAQTARFEFVNFDDSHVFKTPQVRDGLTLDGLRWAWTTSQSGCWQPLTWMSHMLDSQIYGPDRPGGHHVTNVVIHTASVVLLFLLWSRLTGAVWASAAVAAVFAWHPLHVESVAWIFERKDVLCTLFSILAIGAYVSQVRRPSGFKRWLLVPAMLMLALLSKPMAVTLPALLMLMDYWPLERYQGSTGSHHAFLRRCAQLLAEKWPLWLLAVVAAVITLFTQRTEGAMDAGQHLDLFARLANAVVALGDYLQQAVWPTRLAVFYPHSGAGVPLWRVAVAGFLLVALSSLAVWQRSRRPYLIVGWLWFLGMLLPVLGIVQVGEQARADRYTYLALVGPSIMVFWLLREWVRVAQPWRWLASGATVAWLIALAVVAHAQCGYWRNSETLFQHALDVTTDNHVAHTNLGVAYQEQGNDEAALEHYREALRIKPGAGAVHNVAVILHRQNRWDEVKRLYADYLANHADAAVHYDWGTLLAEQGETAAAVAQLEAAVRIDPKSSRARAELGTMYLQSQRVSEALPHLRAATRQQPDDPSTWLALARGYLAAGNQDEAMRLCQHAIEVDPRASASYQFMGAMLLGRNETAKAVACFQQGLRLAPDDVEIHRALGVIFVTVGELGAAEFHFQSILRQQPQNADALYNLGAVRMRQARAADAIILFRQALAARPEFFAAQTSLASLLADSGQAAEAVTLFRAALKSEPNNAVLHFALAQALVKTNAQVEAIDELKEALRIEPKLQAAEQLLKRLESPAERRLSE
jgi:tetratricopeptide (TPR) repeat protein